MMARTPYRGTPRTPVVATPFVVAVQRAGCGEFATPGLHVDERVACVCVGTVRIGSQTMAGDAAARAIARGLPDVVRVHSGSFAAVIGNRRDHTVTAIRSWPGERPLFAWTDGDEGAWISDPSQILAIAPRVSADMDGLRQAITLTFTDFHRSSIDGVRRVLPGSVLRVGADGSTFEDRTLEPRDVGDSDVAFGDALRECRVLLREAIAVRSHGHSEAAVLLSGGLDSAAVAAEAVRLGSIPRLRAVTGTYPYAPSADEAPYTRMTALSLGLELVETIPTPRVFDTVAHSARLNSGVDIMGLDGNYQHLLATAVRGGVDVAMDGHDGDSAFGASRALLRALMLRGRLVTFSRVLLAYGVRRAVLRYGRPWVRPRPGAEHASPGPPWAPDYSSRRADVDWYGAQLAPYQALAPLTLEIFERIGLEQGICLVHPLMDDRLLRFLLSLRPDVKFAGGTKKALVREGFTAIPEPVRRRIEKVWFNEVVEAGSPPEAIAVAIDRAPKVLDGIDWSAARARALEGIGFGELSLLRRMLVADHFVGAFA